MSEQEISHESSKEWEEIWQLFGQEGREALDIAEGTLLKLESNPGHVPLVTELFRAVHNFKGMTRMMGLSSTESLAHRAEDLIALARDEGVDLNYRMVNLLLETVDRLRVILDQILDQRADVEPAQVEPLMQRLETLKAQRGQAAPIETEVQADPEATDEFTILVESNNDDPLTEPAVSEPAEDMFAEALVTVAEKIDPASDPHFVQIFLELAQEELARLHTTLAALDGPDTTTVRADIQVILDTLRHASSQMGYERFLRAVDDLAQIIATPDSDEYIQRCDQAELALFEELTFIEEHSRSENLIDRDKPLDITWLFRHWFAERIFEHLAYLNETIDHLDTAPSSTGGTKPVLIWDQSQVELIAALLRAVYHGCLFYELTQVAHLTLALEDLYTRIGQGEMWPNGALVTLTRSYTTLLGRTVQALDEGEMSELSDLEKLLSEANQILYLHGTDTIVQVTKRLLDLLDLPAEFEDSLSRESLEAAGHAWQAGSTFYTVLANLDENESVCQAFYEWLQSPGVQVITNAAIYQGLQARFNFLLAVAAPPAEVAAAIAKIDGEGRYLSLHLCTWPASVGAELQTPPAQLPQNETPVEREVIKSPEPVVPSDQELPMTEPSNKPAEEISAVQTLDEMMEIVGGLVANQAALHNLVTRLLAKDSTDTASQLVGQEQQQIQNFLQPWFNDFENLAQMETEMSVSLQRLHEIALTLRVKPATEVMNTVVTWGEQLAQRHGKQIKFEVRGGEVELDRRLLNILAQSLPHLVEFILIASMETSVQRQALHKSETGRIGVNLLKKEGYIQLTVTDDGSGLENNKVLPRLLELGWVDAEAEPGIELASWILKDGFTLPDGEWPDLAALAADLAAHKGQLKLASQPGAGLNFELFLPQDMVVIDSMVVRAGQVRYVVPINAIRRILKPESQALVRASADGMQSMLHFEEKLIPIQNLNSRTSNQKLTDQLMLIVEKGDHPTALAIDELIGQQQVLIRPAQGYLAHLDHVVGCALLGQGDIGLVLSMQ